MALSKDLRKRAVGSVVSDGLSRNAAAKLFKVSIASAVRWVAQFETTGNLRPSRWAAIGIPVASPLVPSCAICHPTAQGALAKNRRANCPRTDACA
jgi:hypothetical protein